MSIKKHSFKKVLNSTSVQSFLKHSSFSFGDKEKMAILRGHKSHELSQLARLSSSGVSESVVYILFTGQAVGC